MRPAHSIPIVLACAGVSLLLGWLLYFSGLQTASLVMSSLLCAQFTSDRLGSPLFKAFERPVVCLVASVAFAVLWYVSFFVWAQYASGFANTIDDQGWPPMRWPRFVSASLCVLPAVPFLVHSVVRLAWSVQALSDRE